MQDSNHQRRVIVPEALDAPYQPYRPTSYAPGREQVTPMDSMVRDLYVVQREINQGSHQLYLFFDTFTHLPEPLDLKNFDLRDPKDAQWYNLAIYFLIMLLVTGPTVLTFLKKNWIVDKITSFFKNWLNPEKSEEGNNHESPWMNRVKKFLDFIKNNKMMVVIMVFMIAILLSMVNFSIPLDKEYEYRADPFFVFVCFLSITVAVIAARFTLKRMKKVKLGGETSLKGKTLFRETLAWAALGIWAMGFMCYFIGMYSLGTQKSVLASIVRPALESGKMFVLSDSVKEISFTLRNNGAFMGFYTLCKLGFLLISSFALVSLAWTRINSYWSILDRTRKPGELYVFFGINDSSKILAHSIVEKLGDKLKNDSTLVMVENRNNPVEGIGNGMTISSLMGMFNFRKDAYAETREISNNALLVISDSSIGSRECSKQVNDLIEKIEKLKEVEKIEDSEKYVPFNSLGLKNLSKMIQHSEKCHLFFLDDDPRANIDATDNLRKMINIAYPGKVNATIYCLARNNAISSLLETPLHSLVPGEKNKVDRIKVKILDLSVMAVQSLFMDYGNHPINFVEQDTATATVKSPFESLIIGFGRGGRDIVQYLYEFGAFLDFKSIAGEGEDEDKKREAVRSRFQCTILDKDTNMIKPRFMAKIPAVMEARNPDKNDPLLCFEQASLNSDRFVKLIDEKLKNRDMNFIVISMGNDKTNMSAMTYVINQAMKVREGDLGKLRIFVRNYSPDYESTMMDQAKHFNQLLGDKQSNFINIFGNRSALLTYKMVVNDQVIQAAKAFHRAYITLQGASNDDWDIRHDLGRGIHIPENGMEPVYTRITWKMQNKVMRQETQDIHNGIHVGTKMRLIGINYNDDTPLEEKQAEFVCRLRDSITFDGNRYSFTVSEIDGINIPLLYRNLARNEHIRWNASHEMLGYTGVNPGTTTSCNETAKIHPCLVNWNKLDKVSDYNNEQNPDYQVDYKTYDYIVVKSTFELVLNQTESQTQPIDISPDKG